MPEDVELFESMRLELRRGSLVLAVLARLREERYGYTLRQALAEIDVRSGRVQVLLQDGDDAPQRDADREVDLAMSDREVVGLAAIDAALARLESEIGRAHV